MEKGKEKTITTKCRKVAGNQFLINPENMSNQKLSDRDDSLF